MLDTNKVCLYTGLANISDILAQRVIIFPKCTGGAPIVLLVLLLGISIGDDGSDSITLDVSTILEVSGDLIVCWLVCGSVLEISVNISVDV